MASDPRESEPNDPPGLRDSEGNGARRPWTTPTVTPARIEATTSKNVFVLESSIGDLGPFS